MTEFITRNHGQKEFEVIIKTDSKEHYKSAQDFARKLIDHAKPQTNADRIRAMSDEELAKFIGEEGFHCEICSKEVNSECDLRCSTYCLEWLQQPAEE